MPRDPKFTPRQLERIKKLEFQLYCAVVSRSYEKAKAIMHDIEDFLQCTGHHMRLMINRNLFFEGSIDVEDYELADKGLRIVRDRTSDITRVHLDATALLAICLLRRQQMAQAEGLMELVLNNDKVIKSLAQRAKFRIKAINRFEEEVVMTTLKDSAPKEYPDPLWLQSEAGLLLQKNTSEEELFERLGHAAPPKTKDAILKIDEFSRKRISHRETKLLPSPEEKKTSKRVGKIVWIAFKRRFHAALCDKESEIYQAWAKEGVGAVVNKVYIGTAISTSLINIGAAASALAIPAVALIFKLGVETYCETQKPDMFTSK